MKAFKSNSVFAILLLISVAVPSQSQTLPPGPQVLTFFSDLDDSEQPYSIYIPPNYDASKKYPLVVMLHGAGSNHRLAMRRVFGKSNFEAENDVEASRYFPKWKDVDMIVVAPYARGTAGYQGIVEKDVMDMLADVRERFSIDENRIYLTGLSMGGGGTLWIGLSRPDLWAAIATVCPAPPNGTDALAPNALNMAVQFVHGDADPTVPVSISRDWVAKLKALDSPVVEYLELPGVDHWSWVEAYEKGQIFKWFSKYTRNPFPDRVRHASHDLKHGKAYWLRIDEKDQGKPALIDAEFTAMNVLDIRTTHVRGFTLNLDTHPKFSSGSPLNLTIDGFRLSHSGKTPLSFWKVADSTEENITWITASIEHSMIQKEAGLEGAIDDAFASRHIYVYGTADNPSPEKGKARIDTALRAAEWSAYRGEFLGRINFYPRVVADRDLRQSDFESSNLILFGTAETNSVIAKYKDQLPAHLKSEASKEYGLVYVYPNEYKHYVVINSGLPWWHARDNAGWRILPEMHMSLSTFQDFILFKRDKTVLAEGYFDNNWSMSTDMLTSLTESRVIR